MVNKHRGNFMRDTIICCSFIFEPAKWTNNTFRKQNAFIAAWIFHFTQGSWHMIFNMRFISPGCHRHNVGLFIQRCIRSKRWWVVTITDFLGWGSGANALVPILPILPWQHASSVLLIFWDGTPAARLTDGFSSKLHGALRQTWHLANQQQIFFSLAVKSKFQHAGAHENCIGIFGRFGHFGAGFMA